MIRAILGTVLMFFACREAYGQSADAKPEFDVASIKPSPPPDGRGMRVGMNGGPGTHDPGLFTCQNCSLSMLVAMAYDIKHYQLTGPSWLDSERFDISARVPAGATKEQFLLMKQNLLAERFKLTLHREKKEMPLYELVVAKNGSKLKESVEDPDPADAGTVPATSLFSGPPKLDKDGFPVFPSGRTMMIMMNGRARMQASKESMEQFSGRLANQLGRPVTDATGLKGKYDFTLSWAADGMAMGRGGLLPPPLPPSGEGGAPVTAMPDGDSGPTIFAAIQAQLGLKLEQKKGPIDIFVIDHIEKVPTEN